ncbi:hypothetical protein [Mycolicibacterium fortuitum]|uniref:hypothetical protein n=1 Tax=Mycolicibacterium fortuitum TaxID=1766 RepID=UPI00261F9B4C|nr:hypothetical protein [Mycolicibacterium fortuitum]
MTTFIYGTKTTDFAETDKVIVHPVFDAFLKGNRSGTVCRVGRKVVTVRMDDGRLCWFMPRDLRKETQP